MPMPTGPGLSPLARRLRAADRPTSDRAADLTDAQARAMLTARGWRVMPDGYGHWVVRDRRNWAQGGGTTPAKAVASALRPRVTRTSAT